MIICLCEGVSDKEIRHACQSGARTMDEIRARCGVAAHCGTCQESVRKIARSCGSDHPVRSAGTSTDIKIITGA